MTLGVSVLAPLSGRSPAPASPAVGAGSCAGGGGPARRRGGRGGRTGAETRVELQAAVSGRWL